MKRSAIIRSFLLATTICGPIGLYNVGAAQAQDAVEAPAEGETIVVTARRRDENLQDVPIAITALSAETLREANVQKIEDIQILTPSLTITPTTRGSGTPGYSIRGQRGNTNINLLTDGTISVYFDEFGTSRPTGTNQSMYDLANVQVLKGAQGTLFGRNTTGGAILITPMRPTREFEGYIQGSAGNFDYRDIEAVVNVPLGETLAFRAGTKISRRDGYMRNVYNGEKANDLNAENYRAQLLWTPTSSISSNTLIQHYRSDEVGTAFKMTYFDPNGAPQFGALRPVFQAAVAAEFARNQLLGKYEYGTQNSLSSAQTVTSIQNNTSIELGNAGAFGDITIKNIIGYKKSSDRYFTDFDGSAASIFEFPGIQKAKSFSEEFQIQGDAGQLKYVTGLYYFRESGRDQLDGVFFGPLAAVAPTSFPSLSLQNYDAVNRSWAVFGHADYGFGGALDGLTLSVGARWTKDTRKAVFHNLSGRGANPTSYTCALTGVVQPDRDPSTCVTPAKASFSEPTWDVALTYEASRNLTFYGTVRHGYRSGGFNSSPLLPITPFKPEKVDDIELGFKSQFHLGGAPGRLNFAAYQQKYKDIQRSISVVDNSTGTPRLTNQIQNAAKATIRGLEAELTIRPAEFLQLNASYSYIDAEYDEWQDTYLLNGSTAIVDLSTSEFPNTPRNQFSGSARVEFPMPEDKGELALQVNYYYQSKVYFHDLTPKSCGVNGAYSGCLNRQAQQSGYSLVNARLGWRNVAGMGFDASVFVNNLTDKYYKTGGGILLSSTGIASTFVGTPRMYGLELRFPFGAAAGR